MNTTPDGLRVAPRDPVNLIWIGLAFSIIGGVMLAVGDEIGAFASIPLILGGVVGTVGVIAMGVVIGMRSAFHEEYLKRLIDAGADDD